MVWIDEKKIIRTKQHPQLDGGKQRTILPVTTYNILKIYLFFYFMCVGILTACMSVHHTQAVLWRSEEGIESVGSSQN